MVKTARPKSTANPALKRNPGLSSHAVNARMQHTCRQAAGKSVYARLAKLRINGRVPTRTTAASAAKLPNCFFVQEKVTINRIARNGSIPKRARAKF